MCEQRNQTIYPASIGYIVSPNYPNNSLRTDGDCVVDIVVDSHMSVEIKVEGMFDIPTLPEDEPHCYFGDRYFWITKKQRGYTHCGIVANGTTLRTIHTQNSEQNPITVGFNYGIWGVPIPTCHFRIIYIGEFKC